MRFETIPPGIDPSSTANLQVGKVDPVPAQVGVPFNRKSQFNFDSLEDQALSLEGS